MARPSGRLRFTKALDYELELGAVLRKPLLNTSPQEALDAIGGFVVVNDWSACNIQPSEMATSQGPQKCKHYWPCGNKKTT